MVKPVNIKGSNVQKVINGDYPREALYKMNRGNLEKLVLNLVAYSSDAGAKDAKDFLDLYRSLCLKEINKPLWWPSENIIAQSLTSDGKQFMEILRFLVYKCCQFFKTTSNLNLLSDVQQLSNVCQVSSDREKNFSNIGKKCVKKEENGVAFKRKSVKNVEATTKRTSSVVSDRFSTNGPLDKCQLSIEGKLSTFQTSNKCQLLLATDDTNNNLQENDENYHKIKKKHCQVEQTVALNAQSNLTKENRRKRKGPPLKADGQIPCKRRTLMPKNGKRSPFCMTTIYIPITPLKHKPWTKPPTQDIFLRSFGLQSTFHLNIEDPPLGSATSSSIKFNNCTQVPFSSDLGRELMRRDNHLCPDTLKARRLDRVEWYVNKKPSSTIAEVKYEVTYQEKKDLAERYYKFPKRQIWQHPGDVYFQKKVLLCRRLSVVLVQQDLELMQKKLRVIVTKKW